ncbi:hypothetical protein TWF694_002931 [Orbilia ellipsospora]|uniref:Major facilitator superfamily (MFS) profile domain-containing protein n=1 Tax=Orbilia ellipsospora TaxID=2528407 RepID=A0AAV9X2N7_9PEZI
MAQLNFEGEPGLSERLPLLTDEANPIYDTAKPVSPIIKRDEEQVKDTDGGELTPRELPPGFWGVVASLMIGVVVASIDTSIVMATFSQIGSEFGRLEDANWMIVGYQLGLLATQPMYGKLSDIFGRKSLLLFAYTLFGAGCFWIGISKDFWQVIVGRAISGVGGAGMMSLVSILLNDMVPLRDVASWRSYVYIAATMGRAFGAPLGGFLIDTIGWRWSFLGQVPLALLAIVMVSLRLKVEHKGKQSQAQTLKQRFQRIDFVGATTLAVSLSLLLVFLDQASKEFSLENKTIVGAGIGSVTFGILFLLAEAYVAKEPILSLKVLANRDVVSVYSILGLTTGSQIALVTTVSMYFVITLNVSNTNAAARLVFNNICHALGGLAAGILIRRTGRYRRSLLLAITISTVALILITVRWRGHTNLLETAYLGPSGFGIGMINTIAFVALSASIDSKDQAMATSGFYLSDNLGYVIITSLGNAVLQIALGNRLQVRLEGVEDKETIIHNVTRSIWNINALPNDIRKEAVKAFVEALQLDHLMSTILFSTALFIATVFLREYSLEGR